MVGLMLAIYKGENEKLGQLKKGHIYHYDPKYELFPALKVAVQITDIIHGKTIHYKRKDDQLYEDICGEIINSKMVKT